MTDPKDETATEIQTRSASTWLQPMIFDRLWFAGVFSRFKRLRPCRCWVAYLSIPPASRVSSHGNNCFGFDSGDRSGFCRMIITTRTEPPTRCYHIQALLRLEGFPHNASAQTFKAPNGTLQRYRQHLSISKEACGTFKTRQDWLYLWVRPLNSTFLKIR